MDSVLYHPITNAYAVGVTVVVLLVRVLFKLRPGHREFIGLYVAALLTSAWLLYDLAYINIQWSRGSFERPSEISFVSLLVLTGLTAVLVFTGKQPRRGYLALAAICVVIGTYAELMRFGGEKGSLVAQWSPMAQSTSILAVVPLLCLAHDYYSVAQERKRTNVQG